MQRSTTQTLYQYLPGKVFNHEDGFIAEVHHIDGQRVSNLNYQVLLDELSKERARWSPEQVGIPDPAIAPEEFVILKPELVSWDVYPLTFECTNQACKRVKRWFQLDQVLADTQTRGKVACATCGAKMRQLRYLTAHACGAMEPLFTPACPGCGSRDHMYLEDLGSFRSSTWRCRSCGAAQGTRFTPCACGRYVGARGRSFQQGFTSRDQRLWYPQTLTIINISGQSYDNLQRHIDRGIVALASWIGDESNVARSLDVLARPSTSARMSEEEWAVQEAKLTSSGVDPSIISTIREQHGPAAGGAGAISDIASPKVIKAASVRAMVERAGLFDRQIITDRKSFAELARDATGSSALAAINTLRTMSGLGIEDVSVTQRFPIVIASYGYTRCRRDPGAADLKSYAKPRFYQGKTPVFAVPADTEALLVTFSAMAILMFLQGERLLPAEQISSERDAKLELARIMAEDSDIGGDGPAGIIRRLVHSASHALLRALDDGQSGFGESSLAEWIVADALTTAVYVASYNDFTLGAFDTVLRRRVSHWLTKAVEDIDHCDNDPMCSHTSPQRPHAACDRCLQLTFGCKQWNADLDRKLLRRFWLWTRQQATR